MTKPTIQRDGDGLVARRGKTAPRERGVRIPDTGEQAARPLSSSRPRGFAPAKPRELGTPKEAFARLMAQVGGAREVSLRGGYAISTVYGFGDEAADGHHAPWRLVVALSGPTAVAAADYMAARCGGVFVPMAQDCGAAPLLLAEVARQQGEMMAVLVQGLADGRLTTTEARRGIAEINDAMQAQARLRARLQAIVDHAGIDGDQTATGGEG